MSTAASEVSAPAGLIDLASARVGGVAVVANDEFFAEKENLLNPGRGVFIPDKYSDRGKWMDGWETRRRRTPGNDWCVVQLGLRGIIKQVDIDTNHFLGNHPPFASLDAVCLTSRFPSDVDAVAKLPWAPVLVKSPLNPGSQNLFAIANDQTWTHVRLNIFPDGGVARLRVYGVVVPDWNKIKPGELVDLGAVKNGGVALVCSDMFFSSMNNLIMPGRAENMGDGWETKRRRGPGFDWIILKLGRPGSIRTVAQERTRSDPAFAERPPERRRTGHPPRRSPSAAPKSTRPRSRPGRSPRRRGRRSRSHASRTPWRGWRTSRGPSRASSRRAGRDG